MKRAMLWPAIFVAAVGLTACKAKTPMYQKKAEDKNKVSEDIKTSTEKGGQPGSINVTGIIVKDSSTVDSRISVAAKGGIGKDGQEAKVKDANKPKFSSKTGKADLSKLSDEKSLMAVGCDQKVVSAFAQQRNLEIRDIPAANASDISANTIVLCGNLDQVKRQDLSFRSNELILDDVDYVQVGSAGFTKFTTNKLLLLGSNKLATQGLGSLSGGAPYLELNVNKEISDQAGKLTLMSSGANFPAPK